MSIPDFQSFMLPLLQFAGDGKAHHIKEAYDSLAQLFELREEELETLLPSGLQTVFTNRVSWANTFLKKAGLLEAPRRGYLQITELGLAVLEQNPPRINNKYLMQFESFAEFRSPNTATTYPEPDTSIEDSTPQEAFNIGYQRIRDDVETELLETIKSISPARFERIVVDLLVKMGYGGSREDAGRAIGGTGDGGIDGIINEDKLGLDVVYIQAKRWESVVSRPEIQKFAGALQGQRARKGVFITTSSFSSHARDFVANIDSKIILIDGKELTELMFEYNVGVSIVETYEIKKLNTDYFD